MLAVYGTPTAAAPARAGELALRVHDRLHADRRERHRCRQRRAEHLAPRGRASRRRAGGAARSARSAAPRGSRAWCRPFRRRPRRSRAAPPRASRARPARGAPTRSEAPGARPCPSRAGRCRTASRRSGPPGRSSAVACPPGGGAGAHHDPAVLGGDRLRDELERHLDAVPARCASRACACPAWRRSRAFCRARSRRSRGSCTAASAGRGSSRRARRRWARSPSTRASPSSGRPSDFYEQLDPERIAEHIVVSSQDDLHELVERTMEREHPQLWRDLPPRVREGIHERVQRQLPEIVARHHPPDRREHRPAARRQADGDPPHGGAPRAGATGSSPRSARASCASSSTSAFFFGFLLGIPVIFLTQAVPALVGAADRRDRHRLRDQLARDQHDLRADRAAEDRPLHVAGPVPAPPATRPRTSTPTSSPTRS